MPRARQAKGSKKRSNGERTITQRADGRWQAAVYKSDGTRKFLCRERIVQRQHDGAQLGPERPIVEMAQRR